VFAPGTIGAITRLAVTSTDRVHPARLVLAALATPAGSPAAAGAATPIDRAVAHVLGHTEVG
jgi:hypothetical protein